MISKVYRWSKVTAGRKLADRILRVFALLADAASKIGYTRGRAKNLTPKIRHTLVRGQFELSYLSRS
jgi:hypothetical protein